MIDLCIDICIDMCIGMCIDMCIVMCTVFGSYIGYWTGYLTAICCRTQAVSSDFGGQPPGIGDGMAVPWGDAVVGDGQAVQGDQDQV